MIKRCALHILVCRIVFVNELTCRSVILIRLYRVNPSKAININKILKPDKVTKNLRDVQIFLHFFVILCVLVRWEAFFVLRSIKKEHLGRRDTLFSAVYQPE